MNARKEIRDHLIAIRMRGWFDIARCPLINTKMPTWKARKNFWSLCRKHPEIAARLGYTEALIIPSPLHGLMTAERPIFEPPAPVQERPAAVPIPAYVSQETIRGIPRHVSLDDEVM